MFKDDEQLGGFLRHLAEEEARHSRIMGNIADYLRNNKAMVSEISLDEATMDKIAAPFLDCGSRLHSDSLKREHIINCVVTAEFSEWNDIFVYVPNALKETGREFAFTLDHGDAQAAHRKAHRIASRGSGLCHHDAPPAAGVEAADPRC